MKIPLFCIAVSLIAPNLASTKEGKPNNGAKAFIAFQCATFAATFEDQEKLNLLFDLGTGFGIAFAKENPENGNEFKKGFLVGHMAAEAGWVSRGQIREQSSKTGLSLKEQARLEYDKMECPLFEK